MPNGEQPVAQALESFSLSIEHFIQSLGQGISDAQKALNENSIKTQQEIDSDPVLSSYGLQAPWYQFPKVDLELKIALAVTQAQAPAGPSAIAPRVGPVKHVVYAQPVNASYQTHFQYDANASSTITLSIVPVPAPRTVPPSLTSEEVRKIALAISGAKFQLDNQGNPVAKLRFDINFNAAARLWYVLQYDPANPTNSPVMVAIDDATKTGWVITKQ